MLGPIVSDYSSKCWLVVCYMMHVVNYSLVSASYLRCWTTMARRSLQIKLLLTFELPPLLKCRLEWEDAQSHTPETNTISIKGGEDRLLLWVLPFYLFWSYHAFGFGMFTLKALQYFPNMNVMQIDVCNFVMLMLHPTFLNEGSLLQLIIDFELFSHFHLC